MSTLKTNKLVHTANGASEFTLPQTDGSAGQFMKTDGSGNLAFATVATGVDGITMCDTWVVTTSFNEQTDFITSNLSRQQTPATHYGGFGSAMTESSGVFTFPSNGHYYVESTISGYANSGARSYVGNVHYISTNSGGAYSEVVKGYTSGYADSAHWSITISDIYDVTDYSATRWKLKLESNGLNNIFGSTSGNIGLTGVRVIRLGDT